MYKNPITCLIIIIIVHFISITKAVSQDIHFSQFFDAPLVRNPSLAGIFTGDIRVQSVYRSQWNSIVNSYKTGSLNAEYKLPVGKGNDFLTTGLQIIYDQAGAISWTNTSVFPAINFHKSLSSIKNQYLSLGFMGGIVQNQIDLSKMTTNSQYDNRGTGEQLANTKFTYLDGAIGMSFNSQIDENIDNNFFIGLAYHHFNHSQASFYDNPSIQISPKWVGSAGLKLSLEEERFITIHADYSIQGKYHETIGGALYGIRINTGSDMEKYILNVGGFLRWNDSFIPVIKVDRNSFSFSISYDINFSPLKVSSEGRGGFELGLVYAGFLDRNNTTLNEVLCPRF
ncbi:MAG: PorP/SprF family type IX secretion system membrane protein [Flavisolibacter sp.]